MTNEPDSSRDAPIAPTIPDTYRCPRCGSSGVRVLTWINANGQRYEPSDWSDWYCLACDAEEEQDGSLIDPGVPLPPSARTCAQQARRSSE